MAGSVTGSIGSNDVLLKNMATEETLYQILEALAGATVTAKPATDSNTTSVKGNTKENEKNTSTIKSTSKAMEGLFNGLSGMNRVIRGMDSNINNASFAFQAMSRGTGKFSAAMEFAANSISQLQEQFNAYGKLMQIGGVVTDDFGKLSEQSIALGTDLQGLVKLTTEYSTGLKAGSSSVADTLKGMRNQFGELTATQIREYGRLGIGTNQITEQMLLTAESQGGYNSVLARYGKDTAKMNAGMLKTTQELSIFASAVGMNSKLMQDEAAQAQKKIENRIFEATMTDEQRAQTKMFQALTGSYESAIQIMASLTGGPTSDLAGAFLSLKGITGMGKEIDNFMGAVKNGTDINKALTSSGMLEKVNNMSDAEFKQMQMNFRGYSADVQAVMGPLMQMMWSMRGTTEDTLDKKMKEFTKPLDANLPKSIDSFSTLLAEQNQLAKATSALNTQFNRMGVNLALALTKMTNSTVSAGSSAKDGMIEFYNSLMPDGMKLPKEILDKLNNKVDAGLQQDIEKVIREEWQKVYKTSADEANTKNGEVVTLRSRGIDRNTAVPVKMPNGGGIQHLNANDLVENKNGILSTTNSFGGPNNNAGTVATGAIMAARIPTISAITAGSDKYHEGMNSKHNSGMALDFGLNQRGKETVQQTAAATITAMHGLMKEYGLEAGKDYRIDDESTKPTKAGSKWSGPHIHMEMLRPEAANKMRQIFQNSMKAPDQQGSNGSKPLGDGSTVTQLANAETPIKVSQADTSNVVNTDNRDNTFATAIDNLGTRLEYKLDYLAMQIDGSLEKHI
jgi:hypothetical protein